MTNEEIFYKEFNLMMNQLRGYNGYKDLSEVPLPPDVKFNGALRKERVEIYGITDQYYGKLNNSEAMLWDKGALNRRTFNHNGEFIKNKNGDYILEDVPVHHGCTAIVSDIQIGVPNRYSNNEGFDYVDYIEKDGVCKYIYIVPKKYLYKIQLTALVLSWNKLHSYYTGEQVSLTNGHYLYIYVVPYKKTVSNRVRVLSCKASDDYNDEVRAMQNYWVQNGIMFNPKDCELTEFVKGRENLAYQILDGVLTDYVMYDTNKSMDAQDTVQDLENSNDFSADIATKKTSGVGSAQDRGTSSSSSSDDDMWNF